MMEDSKEDIGWFKDQNNETWNQNLGNFKAYKILKGNLDAVYSLVGS